MNKVFYERRMTTWLDLKRNPVTNGEEFLTAFITSSGYSLPKESAIASLIGVGTSKPSFKGFNPFLFLILVQ